MDTAVDRYAVTTLDPTTLVTGTTDVTAGTAYEYTVVLNVTCVVLTVTRVCVTEVVGGVLATLTTLTVVVAVVMEVVARKVVEGEV